MQKKKQSITAETAVLDRSQLKPFFQGDTAQKREQKRKEATRLCEGNPS